MTAADPAPVDPDSLLQRATSRLARGPDPAILAELELAIREFPHHAGLATRYADVLQLDHRLPEAIDAYQRAIALDVKGLKFRRNFLLRCEFIFQWHKFLMLAVR